MPEIKHTFLKGKMNKDLDSRLLPNGEYREAQNVHITKSEGSDVGVIQNIKGNSTVGTITNQGTVIGYYAESESKNGSNRIFYFVKGNADAYDSIYYYDTSTLPVSINRDNYTLAQIENEEDLYDFTTSPPKAIVQGSFLKFSTSHLITGVNLIDDLLFFTDDNNQPRKINVQKAIDNNLFYNNEIKIAVAKYYPYLAPEVLNSDGTATGMQKGKTTQSVSTTLNSTDVTYTGSLNNDIFIGQNVSDAGSVIPAGTTVTEISSNGLTFNVTLSNSATATGTSTLTFESEKDYIEEEFVRFAYRFKFRDGEYSLISPFTQHCFIPKTYNAAYGDDYHDAGLTDLQIKDAYKSTELESMVNDVAQVNLKILLPSSNVYNDYEIQKIEILYKEADSPALKSVALEDISSWTNSTYPYSYKSTLPYKTLPEDEITRVYDNVPLKAKAQEITGNRLIYGNFEQNNNLPSIDFEASVGQKVNTTQKYHIQYPYHTIKQRRTYQVGLVLSDIHGRQSSVVLPFDQNKSAVRVEAKDNQFDTQSWSGDALRITFNDTIPNAYHVTNNPLGWYSWKVVVKQTQQEYYTVYAPWALDDYPNSTVEVLDGIGAFFYTDEDKRTWLTLHGDNINKIPRDTTTNTPEEGVSASNTRLYPKIISTSATNGMSDGPLLDVISIGTYKEQSLVSEFLDGATATNRPGEPLNALYQSSNNHLVAEIEDGYAPVALLTYGGNRAMGVWETEPVDSALDIYYETSTSGLVVALNLEIQAASGGPASIEIDGGTTDSFDEDATVPHVIGALTAKDTGGNTLGSITFTILNVYAQSDLNTNIASKFDINSNNLRVTSSTFYYGTSGETFNVNIRATDGSNNYTEQVLPIVLDNVNPILTLASSGTSTHYSNVNIITTASAVNGSHDSAQDELGLTYSITSVFEDPSGANTNVTSSNLFTIGSSNGELKNTAYFATNKIGTIYRITVRVTDAGGLYDEETIDVEITPHLLVNKYWGNFMTVCTTTNSQNFYLVKNSLSTTNSIEVGDFIYTTYSGGTLSDAFAGYIKTSLSGGENNSGEFAKVAGGDPGEVLFINQSCP
jgi:hypothetical protein